MCMQTPALGWGDNAMKKGPARSRRVFFIGGIEEAFLVGLVSRLENCAEAGGWLTTRVVATRKAQVLIYDLFRYGDE